MKDKEKCRLYLQKKIHDDVPRIFIFHHVGRSGGGDIDDICLQLYGADSTFDVTKRRGYERLDRYITQSDTEKLKTKVITGHTTFGVHEFVPGPYAYFTLLRDPVKEFISQCNWYINEGLFKEDLGLESFTVEQYVQYAEKADYDISRTAVNWLATHWHGERTGKEQRLAINEGCTEEIFNLAIKNLQRHYGFIGITEKYAETVFLLGKMMGWKRLIPYPHTNRSRKSIGKQDVFSPDILERIKKIRFYDMKLYAMAQEWFNDLLDKEAVYTDPDFIAYVKETDQRKASSAESIYVKKLKGNK